MKRYRSTMSIYIWLCGQVQGAWDVEKKVVGSAAKFPNASRSQKQCARAGIIRRFACRVYSRLPKTTEQEPTGHAKQSIFRFPNSVLKHQLGSPHKENMQVDIDAFWLLLTEQLDQPAR
jgi:hypothetical protein